MAFKVLFTTEAKVDIAEGVEWYENKSTGLGEKFLHDLEVQINYISRFPEHFQIRDTGFYEIGLGKFPYVIVYDFRNNNVVVFAVFHTRQNPRKKS
ncbi:type II toxin-antitoxin system RelE/ParE family toxin [Autumnicola psychrophila]|uniref:Type II toxin-antitoxin system RelE/ParE family toxin n=1 Tax=Autumnicola psychrophila TaxID=3075592 RepID=A0ABU3DP10_9FLAO|nr:type II toxin-antitoxin system RelE/ParE family toxin [Zunongwangia sp. F225]MDT0685440.1 type II toxin-antitoxin system RelE/ParE family toxin [Zunongwangia sp. F225]